MVPWDLQEEKAKEKEGGKQKEIKKESLKRENKLL